MLLVTPPRPLYPSRVPVLSGTTGHTRRSTGSPVLRSGTRSSSHARCRPGDARFTTLTATTRPAASYRRSPIQPALPPPSPWAGAAGVGTGGRGLTAQYTTVQPQNGMDSRLCRQSRIISSPKIILSWMGVWVGRVILMNVSKMENSG